ncbi:MAG: helix-turn-helix domain-containing protein [Pedobacter sp.]
MAVRQELLRNGLEPLVIDLGTVQLIGEITQEIREKLKKELEALGFELLADAKSILIDQMKTLIIQKIHHTESFEMTVNWSQLLSTELNHEYKSLSSLFSSLEGMTVEQYIIRQKIERVKELLFYEELNLSEISFQMGYSSVQHLSQQFKKVAGLTPSEFKLSRMVEKRKALDSI